MKKIILGTILLVSFLITTGGNCQNIQNSQITPIPNSKTKLDTLSKIKKQNLNKTTFNKWSLWSGKTQLRGANIYQRKIYNDIDEDSFGSGKIGPPYTQTDFNKLSQLGANWVQLSHPGIFTEKPPYKIDKNIKKNLDNLISMAQNANLFVTIAFRTGPGRSEFTFFDKGDDDWFPASYRNDNVWKDNSTQKAWADMWQQVALSYKNNPIVVGYNLMVEPNSQSMAFKKELWEPDEFYPKFKNNLANWNNFYPQIVQSIRQIDTKTPIIVGGMGYSAISWLPYLKPSPDPYLVYSAHQYEPSSYTHDETSKSKYPGTYKFDDEKISLNKNYLQNLINTVTNYGQENKRPVTIDEFGTYRWKSGAASYLDDLIGMMEAGNINHAIWVWDSAYRIKNFTDDDEFNFTHGNKKNNHDFVDNDLLKVIKKYWSKNTIRPNQENNKAKNK